MSKTQPSQTKNRFSPGIAGKYQRALEPFTPEQQAIHDLILAAERYVMGGTRIQSYDLHKLEEALATVEDVYG